MKRKHGFGGTYLTRTKNPKPLRDLLAEEGEEEWLLSRPIWELLSPFLSSETLFSLRVVNSSFLEKISQEFIIAHVRLRFYNGYNVEVADHALTSRMMRHDIGPPFEVVPEGEMITVPEIDQSVVENLPYIAEFALYDITHSLSSLAKGTADLHHDMALSRFPINFGFAFDKHHSDHSSYPMCSWYMKAKARVHHKSGDNVVDITSLLVGKYVPDFDTKKRKEQDEDKDNDSD